MIWLETSKFNILFMPTFLPSRKGFTLIEVMLSVAVISGLLSVGTSAFFQVVSRVAVANAEETYQSSLRRAQTLARNQYQNTNWGLYLDATGPQVVIYSGDTYAARNDTLDEPVKLDGAVEIDQSGLDINFAQLTGEETIDPALTTEVVFSSNSVSRTVSIDSVLGQIDNP